MLLALFAAMPADSSVPGATPQVTSIATVSLRAGACQAGHTQPLISAAVRTTWAVSNMDQNLYDTRLYQNGTLVGIVTNVSQWDQDVSGSVEDGNRAMWSYDWSYRLDVVRKSDGQVVASRTAATLTRNYGGCTDQQ